MGSERIIGSYSFADDDFEGPKRRWVGLVLVEAGVRANGTRGRDGGRRGDDEVMELLREGEESVQGGIRVDDGLETEGRKERA